MKKPWSVSELKDRIVPCWKIEGPTIPIPLIPHLKRADEVIFVLEEQAKEYCEALNEVYSMGIAEFLNQ